MRFIFHYLFNPDKQTNKQTQQSSFNNIDCPKGGILDLTIIYWILFYIVY